MLVDAGSGGTALRLASPGARGASAGLLDELASESGFGLATSAKRPAPRGQVTSVDEMSPAGQAGLRIGDVLLAVNGLVPRDVIDVRLDAACAVVELDVERGGERLTVRVEKDEDDDLGVTFSEPAFDGMKRCNNACEFCFIRGLPAGLRRSLYVKDDDFRYSFLYGNFTTLTNLNEDEWRRLIFQRLSPLRVSVHATDLAVRRDLLENSRAPHILDQIDELGRHGIHIHAQIVLMPGRNDGPILSQTLADLGDRYPAVESAAVVPVGFTSHSRVTKTRVLTAADADAAIRQVETVQKAFRRREGIGFVYAADELYLLADRKMPGARSYDDYPQFQNGVGLVQLFREEWRRVVRRRPTAVDEARTVFWATAPLMAPLLRTFADDLASVEGLQVSVVPVYSSLFGGEVSVAGLVSGQDLVAALASTDGDRVVLPRSMFDTDGSRTIDGWTPERIALESRREIVVGGSAADLLRATINADPAPLIVYRPAGGS